MQKNLKIVVASDSYKGSASTFEVNQAIASGVKRILPQATVRQLPIGDGGENTARALTAALGGEMKTVTVTGPLGMPVEAAYGLLNQGRAIVEMAQASGLTTIPTDALNPYQATTYGTGELIKAALDDGVQEIYVGIGGSATNDGGLGMAQALGYEFKDESGQEVGYGASEIIKIKSISKRNVDPRLFKTKITILSDVTNPLVGINGASYVYGRQKGATEDDLPLLDQLLERFASLLQVFFKQDIRTIAGGGAAGGLGAGLMLFCGAGFYQGVDKILDLLGIDQLLKSADLVITGEGKIDAQSLNGKAPLGIAQRAKKYGLPVIAIVGGISGDIEKVYDHGIDLVLTTVNRPMELKQAIGEASSLLQSAGETAIRSYLLGNNVKGTGV